MADNLKIEIVGDSSKLNAELKLVQAQLKALGSQIDKSVKTGDVARAKELSVTYGEMKTQLVGLNRALAQTGEVAVATSRSMAISARSFRSLDQAVLGLGRSIGGAQAGLIAFGAVRVFSALNNQIDEARKKLIDIRDTAQQTAQAPAAVKAAQDIATSLGRDASDADKFMTGVAESLAKVRTEAGKAIPDIVSGVKVMRGGVGDAASEISGTTTILRGSSKIVFDLANAYKMLGIDAKNYKGTAEGILQLQRDVAAAFLRASQSKLFDPVQLNEIAKAIGKGSSAEALLKILPALLAKMDEAIAKNKELNADIANEEARKAALDRLTKMVDDQIAEHNRLWTSVQTASANALADFVQSVPAWVAGWEQWKQGNKAAVDDVVAYVEGAAARIANALSQAFASARQTLSTSFPGDPSIPAMPFAAGGAVSGPGSGTSDSILARVSNGEYVMRARAVDHWGPRFMASLNALRSPFGFAGGGLVMPQRSLPRFADGGLVAAGGGTPVHLHLGAHSFALSGSGSVVDSLVVEARRQQVRSAGVKPSWFAGRPGG